MGKKGVNSWPLGFYAERWVHLEQGVSASCRRLLALVCHGCVSGDEREHEHLLLVAEPSAYLGSQGDHEAHHGRG